MNTDKPIQYISFGHYYSDNTRFMAKVINNEINIKAKTGYSFYIGHRELLIPKGTKTICKKFFNRYGFKLAV